MADASINPFPGMNPYLETRRLWPEVHNKLISDIHYFLREALPQKYTVIMEERVVVEESIGDVTHRRYAAPDISVAGSGTAAADGSMKADDAAVIVLLPQLYPVREWFIEIRTQARIPAVTILEILSPSHKRSGQGRRDYLEKRQRVLDSAAHLVEVDLLRADNPMPVEGYYGDAPYRILVSHCQMRPQAALYPFGIQSAIPAFAMPLLGDDKGPTLMLGEILDDLYLRGYYDRYVNYNDDPAGPLSDDDREWLDKALRETGLRR